MQVNSAKIGGRNWAALIVFGLIGQIAWTIENMYFNVFLYKTVTYDPNAVAVMVAASALTATITTLLLGVLSDRLGKRKPFIAWGYVVWGFVIMAFTLVSRENTASLFPGQDAVFLTAAIVVVLDCVMTFFGSTANDACFNAWVSDITLPENRGRVEGVLGALPLFATLIVFGALDGFTQAGNWKAFYLISGGLVTLGGLSGFFILKDKPASRPPDSGYFKNIIYGFRPSFIRQNSALYLIFCAIVVYATAQQVYMPYLLVYIEYYLGIKNYAVVLAAVLILAAAISIFGGRLVDRYGKRRFMYISAGLYIVFLLAMYLHGKFFSGTAGMAVLILVGAFMMGGSLVLSLVLTAAMRDHTPPDKRGHIAGIRMIFSVLLPMVIGPFIGSGIIRRGQSYLDAFGEVQYIPNPEIYLGGAIVACLVFIPMAGVVRAMKASH